MDRIEFIEKQAERLSGFRLETMELLNKRAHTLVTLLLGGGGGAAAYAVGQPPEREWVTWALGAGALWLFGVAFYAVWKCLRTAEMFPPGEEPGYLLPEAVRPVEELREGCLRSLDARMKAWAERNTEVGVSLNHAYIAATFTPLAMVVGVVGWAGSLAVRAWVAAVATAAAAG
jgi:hypothetical protein